MAPGGDDDTLVGSPYTAETAAAIPALVAGRYQIVRWLGGGGMGRVYAVLDTELGEHVALKMLRGDLSDEALQRFRREVRLTRKIQHPNVARMFDIGETDQDSRDRFLTMELVDGESLSASLGSPMPWDRLQPIAVQICAGLAAAHEKGVVHRDLKPDNVLLERATGRVVITDFGIARSTDDVTSRVTQTGMIVGTPRYMAPEQLAGSPTDERADMFALGVLLYELASAARPWSGDNPIAIAVAQATQPMRPLVANVPKELVEILDRLLTVEPERRPASARDVGVEIAAIACAPGDLAPHATHAHSSTHPTASGVSPPTQGESAIAVLPFACSSGDEYLASGMRDDLIDMMSTTKTLRVRPAGSIDARVADPRTVGQELGVDHVVVGSLRRTPSGLRVAARLIGVADGFQIWAHRIDCTEGEVLAIGDQLGHAIASALSTRAPSRHPLPTDPRAIELFLQARAEMRRFFGEHALKASSLLEDALAIAPTSAPIAGLLACSTALAWAKLNQPALLIKGRQYADRAIALDHHEGYLASSLIHSNLGDHERGARDLRIALERAPMSAQVHEFAGRMLIEIDPSDAGHQHLLTALGLDPSREAVIGSDIARCEALAGNWEAARVRLDTMYADPDQAVQQYASILDLRLAVWTGSREDVMAALDRAERERKLRAGLGLVSLVRTWHAGGAFDPTVWEQTIAALSDPSRPRRMQISILQRAIEIAVLIGQLDRALDGLDIASQLGLADVVWLDLCPLLVNITHPRWRALRDAVAARASRTLAVVRGIEA